MNSDIYQAVLEKIDKQQKLLAVLIDPDKTHPTHNKLLIRIAEEIGLSFFFVGGSLISNGNLESTVMFLKSSTHIPVVIFPGNNLQITQAADAILLLSLISGRNPDFLIGQHVLAAPRLQRSELEIIPTGYMLVDCGRPTSASYMSNTQAIPYEKSDIAVCTALAGQQLGLKMIYLDGGSGAKQPISTDMIQKVRHTLNIPLIVGGGIRQALAAQVAFEAGANMVVIGTSIEQQPEKLYEFGKLLN